MTGGNEITNAIVDDCDSAEAASASEGQATTRSARAADTRPDLSITLHKLSLTEEYWG